MLISDRLLIIGTNHISLDSKKKIKKEFKLFNPDVVAIELDHDRLPSLLSDDKPEKPSIKMIKKIGVSGYIFLLIASFAQKKLGGIVNVRPGVDMKTAYFLAKNNNKNVLLVDQPIKKTLRNISKKWSKKEKFKIFFDLFKREKISINIKKIPSEKTIKKLLSFFKKKYPSLYSVLIEDRNKYIVKKVKEYQKRFPDNKVLLVVGAGHVDGVVKLFYSHKN